MNPTKTKARGDERFRPRRPTLFRQVTLEELLDQMVHYGERPLSHVAMRYDPDYPRRRPVIAISAKTGEQVKVRRDLEQVARQLIRQAMYPKYHHASGGLHHPPIGHYLTEIKTFEDKPRHDQRPDDMWAPLRANTVNQFTFGVPGKCAHVTVADGWMIHRPDATDLQKHVDWVLRGGHAVDVEGLASVLAQGKFPPGSISNLIAGITLEQVEDMLNSGGMMSTNLKRFPVMKTRTGRMKGAKRIEFPTWADFSEINDDRKK